MLRKMCGSLARHPWLRKAVVSTPGIRDLAWRFVAGENLDAGLSALRALNARGIKGTLNYVGTHVRRESDAIAATDAALEALRRIHQEKIDSHLSVKPTQIGLDVAEDCCRVQLRRILDQARDLGNFVRIDMEESPYIEVTLRLFEEMRDLYGVDTVGIVVQSYLRHRAGDLERLMAGGSRIRLVKGGYWEPPTVVYRKQADIDAAFHRDIELLLRHGRHPAIATHDTTCIEYAQRVAATVGRDPGSYEFQMLYGVRPDLQNRLASEGCTVRCYVPYGSHWYEYFLGCVRRVPGGLLRRFREWARPTRPPLVGARGSTSL